VWWVARIHPTARYETKLLVTVLLSVLVHLLIELPLNRKIRNWSFLHSKND
jgi:peptidoglycan/LPS O-acetylase OafA/YrhL